MNKLTTIVVSVFALLASVIVGPAWANSPEFSVERLTIVPSDDVYRLDADLRLRLSDHMIRALNNGVSMAFLLDVDLYADRRLIWREHIAGLKQRYILSFHLLSRQYVVRNVNAGTQVSYPGLTAALNAMGNIDQLPVVDVGVLDKRKNYLSRVRFYLDHKPLPVPLRVKTYFKKEWRASTPWIELMLDAPGRLNFLPEPPAE